jgi:membrane protease YdiL (CAAX protease family)
MDSNAGAPGGRMLGCSPPSTLVKRVVALFEVLVAFVVVHLSYRSFKNFTELGSLEGTAGLNFSAGSVMILFTFVVLMLFRRNFQEFGITWQGWRYSLNIGLLWGVLSVVGGVAIVRFAPIHFDPRRPPDMSRALLFAVCELVGVFVLVWFLMRERRLFRRIPSVASLLVLVGLRSLPLAVSLYSSRPLLNIVLTVLWLFFGAGFGEEIFFRGYIQSRLNQAFGRPFHFMGMDFGLGLIVSSLLFGFIHVLNTVDYFNGRWDFAWWWWLPAFVSGLFYGCLRESTNSIVAGSVHHGLTDVLARVPSLLP